LINFYIAATPIGNYQDITLRALQILKDADFIVCESEKEYKKLFSILGLKEKKYIVCNEHGEADAIDLVLPLLKNKETGALISDCGTPLFEDPGFKLVDAIRKSGYRITSLPGPNSIITALSLAPFKIKDFYYSSLLPKNKELRIRELIKINKRKEAVIIIEAPYRLLELLDSIKEVMGRRKVFLAYDLTLENEAFFYEFAETIIKELNQKEIKKGEFIIILEPMK
jgi:16S rRNA (cytidine1402-2'-O)-methyltransferase